MSTPSEGDKNWWRSLPPEVKKQVREFVNEPEVEIEPQTIAPEALPPEMRIPPETPTSFAVAVNQMTKRIERAKEEVEGAIQAWHALDHEIISYVESKGHRFEEASGSIWHALTEPVERLNLLHRRLEVLSGLLDEMNLATGPDSLETLEANLKRARDSGSEEAAGIVWEAIGLRKSYSSFSRTLH